MEKYLLSLLNSNSRVILPGLGAFIIRQEDPLDLVFNDLLAFDDGMLSEFIEKTEGLSREEAESRITDYVDKLKQTLAEEKTLALNGIGILRMDASGKIGFEPTPTGKTKPDSENSDKKPAEKGKTASGKESRDMESFTLSEKDAEVEVDATEDSPLDTDREEPPFTMEEEGKKEQEQEQDEVPEVNEPPDAEAGRAEKPEEGPGTGNDKTDIKEPVPIHYTYRRKKKVWPWIAGAAALIAALLVVGWFVFPEQGNFLKKGETVTGTIETGPLSGEEQTVGENPSGDGETVPIEETMPAGTAPSAEPAESRYYVVAGCFENIANAEAYVIALKNLGYDARIFGMRKNLHAVCFNAYSGRSEALAEMNRIRRTYDTAAWVLYY